MTNFEAASRPMPTAEQILQGEPIPVLDHGYCRYVAHLGDDLMPLQAARMSTGNPTGVDEAKDAATRDFLWRHAHATPFEMAVLQIEVQVPIFVAREWHRHRTQCLAGDTALYFDLPGAKGRAKDNQFYKVSIQDFHRRWHQGVTHPITKRKPSFVERLESDRWYSIPELAVLVERRKETLRNLIRDGKLIAQRRETTDPRQPALWVRGADWAAYCETDFVAQVPMRERLSRMQLRMCDEATGEIRHTTVADVWESGVKPTFRVTFENGYTITTSKDHRFFTADGWKTLEQSTGLKLGKSGAVSWRSDAPKFAANGVPAHQDFDWLSARRSEGLDVQRMADLAGCSYMTVRKCLKVHGLQFTAEERSRLSGLAQRGQHRTGGAHAISDEGRARIVAARSGPNSNFWKGGVAPERASIARWTREQAAKLHQQNGYTCLICDEVGGALHTHHLDPVWHNAERARDLTNLVTLCDACHRRVHAQNAELELMAHLQGGKSACSFFEAHPSHQPVPAERPTATGRRTMVAHYVAIRSIEFAGEQMTYDIEVTGPFHNFVADGMVVHNSFNEFSGRYAEMPALYYQPSTERVQGQSTTNKQASGEGLDDAAKAAYLGSIAEDQALVRSHYEDYLEAGVARELARINLPLSQYTRFRAQANLRNWFHFLNLRMAANAQYEIRVYAHEVARVIRQLWPRTYEVFAEHTLEAATLSKSERSLLLDLLSDALGKKDASELAAELSARLGDRLGASRKRELLAKLGL